MLTGAILAAIFGLASYAATYGWAYGWRSDDVEAMMKFQLTTSISAAFSQVLFLIGVLLQALRGSSESARIAELEAIIRDRDH